MSLESLGVGLEGDHHTFTNIFWRTPQTRTSIDIDTTKKDTSVTFWAEQKKLCHTYDTSMTIIVTKPVIIIDVVGSYFYDKKS